MFDSLPICSAITNSTQSYQLHADFLMLTFYAYTTIRLLIATVIPKLTTLIDMAKSHYLISILFVQECNVLMHLTKLHLEGHGDCIP